MRQYIINLGTSPCNFNIHLIRVNPVTIPSSFFGNNQLKLTFFIAFIRC